MDITEKDILVKTQNPERLDDTLQQFGAAVVGRGMPGGYAMIDDCYVVRIFGDVRFIEFLLTNQGYGEFVRELDELV